MVPTHHLLPEKAACTGAGPQDLRMEEPKKLKQLPTPEDPGHGYQNKKHLSLWVLQSQIIKALQGHSPRSSHSCTFSTASSSSWARLKPALGLPGTQFRFPRSKGSRI